MVGLAMGFAEKRAEGDFHPSFEKRIILQIQNNLTISDTDISKHKNKIVANDLCN